MQGICTLLGWEQRGQNVQIWQTDKKPGLVDASGVVFQQCGPLSTWQLIDCLKEGAAFLPSSKDYALKLHMPRVQSKCMLH